MVHTYTHKHVVGFRIWDAVRVNILLYLLKKSVTWTIPYSEVLPIDSIADVSFELLKQFPGAKIKSVTCMLNTKDIIDTQTPLASLKYIVNNYTIYNLELAFNKLERIKLPDHIQSYRFIKPATLNTFIHSTPLLKHLDTCINGEK